MITVVPTHPSSQSPAPSEFQPRGETCPAPHGGPSRLVQSTLFAAFGNYTSTTASSGGATSPATNKMCTSPIQAYTTQGATTYPLPVAAMLESTPDTPPLSRATDTLGVSIHSLSESPPPSSALPPAGRDEGVMSLLPFSSLQLLEDGDEDEDFQLITVTEPTQSACRMPVPTAMISELSLSRSVSPPS
ncbi:hypothetical protein PAXRUDRAFT_648263 [Paxillus rubicundulus Ve08.2h10]|uniref:Uncharacterized protein n=1 Tax=Paxillus rubicundulus Ve08.2h10 TaxID=930991 RepID=A0A0D0D3Q5_9AGAM|nr:hypothetical protein PAXRUDRAFT_648263 [Paxillus rubicundulus Ve08.2h10]